MSHSAPPLIASLVNGRDGATVSVLDRGLSFGDGVFETIRVRAGVPRLWPAHRRRLQSGCKVLNISIDISLLDNEVKVICSKNALDAILKIILTRGVARPGYVIPDRVEPTRILMLMPPRELPAEYRRGIAVKICKHRLPLSPRLAKIKHLNRLDQILARSEWNDEYHEGLMLDQEKRVIEGTASNLFICRDKRLLTPSLENCGVAGVMREYLLDNAESVGLEAVETDIYLEDVFNSDGAFLCNVLNGLLPIRDIEGTELPIAPVMGQLCFLTEEI